MNNDKINTFTSITAQRQKEIEEGLHYATRAPIYCVIDKDERIVGGHSDYTISPNQEYGYIDEGIEPEDRDFSLSDERMINPVEVTRFFIDRYVSFHLTRKSAADYMIRQKHNLSERAYLFVHSEGYAQYEIEELFDKE